MKKIKIICLGKTKQKFIKDGINEYLKRISSQFKMDFLILPDVKLSKNNSVEIVKKKEAKILQKHIKSNNMKQRLKSNIKTIEKIKEMSKH